MAERSGCVNRGLLALVAACALIPVGNAQGGDAIQLGGVTAPAATGGQGTVCAALPASTQYQAQAQAVQPPSWAQGRSPYDQAIAQQAQQAAAPQLGQGEYVQQAWIVQVGDQLWYVALVVLGDPYRWPELYGYNQQSLQNPNQLNQGQALQIPDVADVPLAQLYAQQYRQQQGPAGQQQYLPQQQYAVPNGSYQSSAPVYQRRPSSGMDWGQSNWDRPVYSAPVPTYRTQPQNQQQWQAQQQQQQLQQQQQQQQQQQASNGAFNQAPPLRSGTVSSNFGYRRFDGKLEFHDGLDIAVGEGTPIAATGDGVVVSAGWNGGYGNLVKVRHRDGTITYYAHCKNFQVRAGQTVRAGQQIATVNSTGRSTGNHIHFAIEKGGKFLDPRHYFRFPAQGSRI